MESTIKVCANFITMTKELIIPNHNKMVSFDLTSLFTNVPTELAKKLAERRLGADEGLEETTNLTVVEIMMLLKFCLDATYSLFKNEIYKQKFGIAMRSPVSVTVANLVMEEVDTDMKVACG